MAGLQRSSAPINPLWCVSGFRTLTSRTIGGALVAASPGGERLPDLRRASFGRLEPRPGERPATSKSSQSHPFFKRKAETRQEPCSSTPLHDLITKQASPIEHSQLIWSTILPRVCRPATRPNASRTWPKGRTASTCGRSWPGSTKRESASSRCRPPWAANDSPVMPRSSWRGPNWGDHRDRPAAIADGTHCLVHGLTTDAIEEQVDAAGDYGHGPVRPSRRRGSRRLRWHPGPAGTHGWVGWPRPSRGRPWPPRSARRRCPRRPLRR